MRLADSNILIYAAKPEYPHLKKLLSEEDIAVSALSKVECLGFHNLTAEAEVYLNAVFSLVKSIPIDGEVIKLAIVLRREKKMKTADAIIAATALFHCTELITRNTVDFQHIPDLIIHNPID